MAYWYNDLQENNKRSAKKLFGKINQLTVEKDEKKELFKHGVLSFESFKIKWEFRESRSKTSKQKSLVIRSIMGSRNRSTYSVTSV